MADIKKSILSYLDDQLSIETETLNCHNEKDSPLDNSNPEIKLFREKETQRVRDRIQELKRHIAVLKRM